MRGKPWWVFPVLLTACFAAEAATRPAISRPSLVAPVIVDGQTREQAWVFPDEANEAGTLIEAEPLLQSLAQDLVPTRIDNLRGHVESAGVIRLSKLRDEGLEARFDPLRLELVLGVPATSKRILTRNVVNREFSGTGTLYGQSPASAYLNLRSSQPFRSPPQGGQNRQPLTGQLELATQWHKWVLETGAFYTERAAQPWIRDDTTLVRDDEKRALRYQIGDQNTPSVAYLSGRSLGGVGLSRVFAIQPNTTTQPVSRTELLLKRPSTVEVIVNGTVQNTMRLAAGPVSIQDFPLASGFNNVVLRVTDDLGRTELVNLTIFYDAQALGRGVHSFSYHVGLPSTQRGFGRKYDEKNPNFTFFHRAGLTDQFTLGLFGQGDDRQNVGGLEAIRIGRFGSLSLTTAGSRIAGLNPDVAGRLRYQTLDGYRGQVYPLRFSLEGEYRGWRFAQLGSTPNNPYSWSLDAYTLYRSRRGIDFGLGGRYQFKRTAAIDGWQARSDLSTLLSDSFRAAVNYSYTRERLREHRAFFTLTWVQNSGRHYVNASHDSLSKTSRVDAVRNAEQPYDDVQLAAGVQRSPTEHQVSALADYNAQRANFRLDHQSVFARSGSGQGNSHLSTFGLNTALVWAGSSVALSRPVTDSFAILPARKAARGQELLVNPQGTSAEAYVGGWMPAVLPNVNSYYETPVSLDTTSLPLGVSVPEEYFRVKNSYRAGAEIPVGARSLVTVVGSLKNKKREPIALASGEVLRDGAKTGQVFFTNQRGQFVVENLDPGTYRLRFYDGDYGDVIFIVPGRAVGLHRLGELVEKEKK